MRRLPPQQIEKNLSDLIDLAPALCEDLLSSVDQPLKIARDKETGKDYLLCDYNRDGDSYRSPWSNTYDPPLDDGAMPSDRLRKLEVEANQAFDQYRIMYFEGGVSSVYLWDLDHGFAGVILIKKAGDGSKKIRGCWDSIHVVEVQERGGGRNAHYKLTSTAMLWLQTSKEGSGTMNLGGSLTRQVESDSPVNDANPHIVNIGRMVEDMENKMRSTLNDIYFGKTSDIVNTLRSVNGVAEKKQMINFQAELTKNLKIDLDTVAAIDDADKRDANYYKKITRSLHGLSLLKALSPIPPSSYDYERMYSLLSMLFAWLETVSCKSHIHLKIVEIVERYQAQAVDWIKKVERYDLDLYCDCLLPLPPVQARIGLAWDSLMSENRQLLEGLQRLSVLVRFGLVSEQVWERVLPFWMQELKEKVTPDELPKFKVILRRIFDTGSDVTPSYSLNFIERKLQNVINTQRQEGLIWIQRAETSLNGRMFEQSETPTEPCALKTKAPGQKSRRREIANSSFPTSKL
eukprot:Seg2649.4 transcript_id=Seg2649.4/GoldUCD/mRNA.D3Y31 product="F-actin-capping protein subunit beta" protein_id=Seg2649.4/GoldUCD/D3Y31